MNNISCDVCMDLIPLVNDGVASEQSQKAVTQHTVGCPNCKKSLDGKVFNSHKIDDAVILRKIKKRAVSITLILALLGALVGIGFSDSAGMFYNVMLMPAIGAICFLSIGKKSLFAPLCVFVLEYARCFLQNIGQINWKETSFMQAIVSPGYMALVYAVLCLLGLAIGFLLKYAFHKEDKYEKIN